MNNIGFWGFLLSFSIVATSMFLEIIERTSTESPTEQNSLSNEEQSRKRAKVLKRLKKSQIKKPS